MSKAKKNYDPGLAVKSGDAFLAHGNSFLTEIGPDKDIAAERASRDIGGFVASATNLALAVELYLKSLWMMYGYDAPEHHRLWALFKRLPNRKMKELIAEDYRSIVASEGTAGNALEVVISLKPLSRSELSEEVSRLAINQDDVSLAGVLKRADNSFVTWRYLHEQASDQGVRLLSYEFERIKLAARAIRGQAVRLINAAHSSQA